MMMDPEITRPLQPSGIRGRRNVTGLFQQKRDAISILMPDTLVVARLNQMSRASVGDEARGTALGDGGQDKGLLEGSRERKILGQKIDAYNRGKHSGAFMVTQTEGSNFEGALRFYHEDGSKKVAKAIWLSSLTTVDELMPRIRAKFNIADSDPRRTAVCQVQNQDEIRLAGEERPLDIAVSSKSNLRFVLRMEPLSDNPPTLQPFSNNSNDDAGQHKSLSRFFGVESGDLTVPYYSGPVSESPGSKAKPRTPSPKAKKKLGAVDSASLSSNGTGNSSNHLSVGYVKRSKSVGNIGNVSMPGLLLKNETPNFIKKFQSGEGAMKNFIKKDKGNTGKVSSKGLSPKKRSRAKSLTGVFERGFILHKKDESLKPANEVSEEESSPGLLKIFGDKVCPNATYKSVLASMQSSAVALIKVVLERFSLPVDSFGEYVLCDVIGNYKTNPEKISRVLGISDDYKEKQEWETECMRVLGDDERPLAIKLYWKPEVGFARRFEIRRRADISAPDADTITYGINMNAKRLQMLRAHRATSDASLASFQEEGDEISEELSSSFEQETVTKELQRKLSRRLSDKEETESSDEQLPARSLLPPQGFPYLLTLHGGSRESDRLLYILDNTACLIGCSTGSSSGADIKLHSMDVNQEHCRILMQPKSCDNGNHTYPCDMFAEPVGDSKVLLNGIIISHKTRLNPEDVIGIGDHYLFLLKNPLAPPTTESTLMRLLTSANQSDFPDQEVKSPVTYATPHIAAKALEYAADSRRLKLSYPMRGEDELLKGIASLLPASLGDDLEDESIQVEGRSILSLSYLMCMCLEHSAYNFDQERTKQLMLKVATLIQTLAWDKTKEIARNQQERPSDDVQTAMGALLPDLRVIVCLLTNALEILNFLQTNMADYVAVSEREGGDGGVAEEAIEEEALVELEEVVTYTFQQIVYYLTKTLYISIPNFLDSNPFTEGNGDDDVKTRGMDSILSVFQMTLELMRDLDVHPEIRSQLFAYLLFFTNASLFNLLVERGSSGKFYKWSKGAQIRGNLDVLEAWIQEHDLQDQAKFLTRVSMAIDLLATPKVQLMQADWSSLKCDFHELSTVQLHHILSQYQLGANQSCPTGWLPPPEEMKSATDTENILESFDSHPALALPNHGFELDLRRPMSNKYFPELLHELKRRLPCITFNIGTEGKLEPQAEASDLEKKLTNHSIPVSPCMFPDQPWFTGKVNGTSISESRAKMDANDSSKMCLSCPRIVRTDTDNSCDTIVDITTTGELLETPCVLQDEVPQNEQTSDEAVKSRLPTRARNTSAGHLEALEEPKKPSSSASASSAVTMETKDLTQLAGMGKEDAVDDVFVVDLEKREEGVGLGLIDGMHSPLRCLGIYVRKLVPGGPAMQDGRLMVGDRILAVNGTSLVGADYNSAMQLIRTSGNKLRFLVAKSEPSVAQKISASIC